jgi:hypothetical protein
MSFRVVVLAVAVVAGTAWPVRADEPPPAADRLASAELPGTPERLARVAGLATTVERSRLLLEIVRTIHGVRRESPRQEEQLRVYLDTLEAAGAAWRAAGADGALSLPPPTATAARPVTAALASAGWRLARNRDRWRLDKGPDHETRHAVLQAAGVDVAALARRLEAGEAVPWPVASFTVPLPLGTAAWRALLGPRVRDDAGIAAAILGDRRAALLYYGLSECGSGTLAFAAGSPAMLESFARRAPAFASFGASFSVAGGRVATPGGLAHAAAWEVFVGQPTSNPQTFFDLLLAKDDGRLAWFYETLGRMDPSAVTLVMGGAGAPLERQAASLASIYGAFEGVARGFSQPGEREPLVRAALDPALLLLELKALPTGQLAPPASRALWDAVFESEETPERLRLEPGSGDVSAAFLIEKVFEPVRQHRYDRFDAVAFAQRVLGATPDADLPEAAVALRGFGRYRTLLVTLERIGVRDAKTYARAVRHAARIGDVRAEHLATALYAQFQGALALIERLHIVRRLDQAETARLLDALLAIDVSGDDRYAGAVAGWIDAMVLPALGIERLTSDAPLLEALSGVTSAGGPAGEPRSPPTVWLDWSYRLDLGAAALDRLRRVRERQGGNALATALSLARIATALGDRSLTVTGVTDLTASLREVNGVLVEPVNEGRPERQAWTLRPTMTWALGELGRISQPGRLSKAADVGERLLLLSDLVLAEVLRSLAYAPHLGDPSGPLLLGGDVSHRHDFGLTINDPDTRLHAAWSLPESPIGHGLSWQVWGALLGLDIGLANLALPPATLGAPGAARAVSERGRKAVLQGLALFNPYDVTDTEMRQVADVLRRGRAVVAALPRVPDGVLAVASRAGLATGRARALAWSVEHDPAQAEGFFGMPELIRLGRETDGADAWTTHWGAPLVGWNGSLQLGWNATARMQAGLGASEAPLIVAGFPDLYLRLAESIADLNLPARIAGPLLKVIVADFLDHVTACREDDPLAWARYAASYPRARFETAVSGLTAEGVLRPAAQP